MVFKVFLKLEKEEFHVQYNTVEECLKDSCLKSLINSGLVQKCSIQHLEKRITGLPAVLMNWSRFEDQVLSNRKLLDSIAEH